MTQTHDNLMAAFAGESQANQRYLAYAKKADQEGFRRSPGYSERQPRPNLSMLAIICEQMMV